MTIWKLGREVYRAITYACERPQESLSRLRTADLEAVALYCSQSPPYTVNQGKLDKWIRREYEKRCKR